MQRKCSSIHVIIWFTYDLLDLVQYFLGRIPVQWRGRRKDRPAFSQAACYPTATGWRCRGARRSLPRLHGRGIILALSPPLVFSLAGVVVSQGVARLVHKKKEKELRQLRPTSTTLPRPFPASGPSPSPLCACSRRIFLSQGVGRRGGGRCELFPCLQGVWIPTAGDALEQAARDGTQRQKRRRRSRWR